MAVTLSLALALAACGGSDGAEASGSGADRDRPTTTLSRTQRDEQAVRELIEGWFEQRRKINHGAADIDSAKSFASEDAYAYLAAELDERRDLGIEARADPDGRTRQSIESVEVSGDTATAVECVVDGDLLVRTDSGEVVNDEVAALRAQHELSRSDRGMWRITHSETIQKWEDSQRCA